MRPKNIETSPHWRQYNAADYGRDIDLTWQGALPRRVVLLAEGDLRVSDSDGAPSVLTGLPSGYTHEGAPRYILAGQSVSVVVYW